MNIWQKYGGFRVARDTYKSAGYLISPISGPKTGP